MTPKKEKGLRDTLKTLFGSKSHLPISLSWIESPDTSPGVPDLSYCHNGVEGWIELKCGPRVEVKATQVNWFEDRIAAGGLPLFLAQWGLDYMIVPGSAASILRRSPGEETWRGMATTVWHGEIVLHNLLYIMMNPKGEYEDLGKSIEGTGIGVRKFQGQRVRIPGDENFGQKP